MYTWSGQNHMWSSVNFRAFYLNDRPFSGLVGRCDRKCGQLHVLFSVVEREARQIMKRHQDESGTCKTSGVWITLLSGSGSVISIASTRQMTWLDCSSKKERGKKVVVQLKCKVCSNFVEKIRGSKNFSRLCKTKQHS